MVKIAGTATGAFWLPPPPISQEEASIEFGADIADEAWQKIERAFAFHELRLKKLEQSRDNKNPNDPRSWAVRKNKAENGLKAALKGLERINRDWLAEAQNNRWLAKIENPILEKEDLPCGKLDDRYGGLAMLDSVIAALTDLQVLVEAAALNPQDDIPSEAECRQLLAREIYEVLGKPELLSGWGDDEDLSYDDLTGFEKLVEALEIHQGVTPAATAQWVRKAM